MHEVLTPEMKAAGVKEKILIVDDEPSIRKYLQTLL